MCLRNIRTTQERRANQDGQWVGNDFGMKIKIRGRRLKLPNAWDDIPRRDWNHRSWKRHRLTQYHIIEA